MPARQAKMTGNPGVPAPAEKSPLIVNNRKKIMVFKAGHSGNPRGRPKGAEPSSGDRQPFGDHLRRASAVTGRPESSFDIDIPADAADVRRECAIEIGPGPNPAPKGDTA